MLLRGTSPKSEYVGRAVPRRLCKGAQRRLQEKMQAGCMTKLKKNASTRDGDRDTDGGAMRAAERAVERSGERGVQIRGADKGCR